MECGNQIYEAFLNAAFIMRRLKHEESKIEGVVAKIQNVWDARKDLEVFLCGKMTKCIENDYCLSKSPFFSTHLFFNQNFIVSYDFKDANKLELCRLD
jgi:hypothetical protein